jgi:hypothetical protein
MHSPIGQNHPVHISQFDSPMPPPPFPGSLRQRDTSKSIINKETWPKRGSSSRGASSHVRGVVTRPFVVPRFVSELQMPVKTASGYQSAHGIYDEMRQFFAQRAMSNGEVVVIKITMMSLKPGNRNPSVVSVRGTSLSHPHFLSPLFTEYIRDCLQYPRSHWCSGTQEHCLLNSSSTFLDLVQGRHPGYRRSSPSLQGLGRAHPFRTWRRGRRRNLIQVLPTEREIKNHTIQPQQGFRALS